MSKPASNAVFSVSHSFWWPVTVSIPTDDGPAEMHFEARIKMGRETDIFADTDAGADVGAMIERDRQVLRAHISDWRGVQDEAGEDLAFSAATLEDMIAFGPWRRALVEAVIDAVVRGGAREKN